MGGGQPGREKEHMIKHDGQDGERTEMESKERDILIEGAVKELVRNLALGKFQGIQKDNPN